MKMPFGQYKGMLLSQLDPEYLAWLLTIARNPLLRAVRQELATRHGSTAHDLALARQIITRGFRQLALDCHPDHGGQTAEMQRLNMTKNWLMEHVVVRT